MKNVSILFLCLICSGAAFAQPSAVEAARAYRKANEVKLLSNFVEFLSLPNIATDTPAVYRDADFIVAEMKRMGLNPQAWYLGDKGTPPGVVYGEYMSPGATRTIIFYAHYDGQPVDPKQWTVTPPFTPALLSAPAEKGGKPLPMPKAAEAINPEWRLYARSASDDKSGVFAILTAFEALRSAKITPTVNVKFVFEGEEEAGSVHLGEMLGMHKDLLKADAFIVCDGPVHQSGRKQVVFGVRGDTNVDLTVYGANRPLHSGHYGNWSPNPALLLAKLLASMKDDPGTITIKGWDDDVEPQEIRRHAAQRLTVASMLIEPPIFTQVPVASTMWKPRP